MALKEYRRKRAFAKTPEPAGRRTHRAGPLRFVVQKHYASRVHYDVRLEMDGVLKSWAVPKGPSRDPDEKRLAVMTEDHPLEYRTFEGVIPEGNYGAGLVSVWDSGTYHLPGGEDPKETEAAALNGLKKGHIDFFLEGKKLKGTFTLVRMAGAGKNTWLLIKKHDEAAVRAPRVAPSLSLPIKPMLASLAEGPFNRKGWIFEPKWDGFRAVAVCRNKHVTLYSRSGASNFTAEFDPIVRELETFRLEAVLDGEIVVVDTQGRPSFQLLQNYLKSGNGALRYYVFDILELDGEDVRRKTLAERKELLRNVIPRKTLSIFFNDYVEESGKELFRGAEKAGLEGIIAKNGASAYLTGVRSREWLKIKTHPRQEAVIAGFTEPRGGRKFLGALVLGVYDRDGTLRYVGHTGGKLGNLELLRRRLAPLETKKSPFGNPPKTNAPVHWLTPKLVAEITFREWTETGHMRQPIFVGLREDKDPKKVVRETPVKNSPEFIIHHADKIFWPEEGYTKGDVADYYRAVSGVLLPYVLNRPQSLNRFPEGINGMHFYHKNVGPIAPDWIKTVSVYSKSNQKTVEYLVCDGIDSVLYMVNLGCIEINPWSSRVGSLDRPDYCILDLDPEDIDFSFVVKTARAIHSVLEAAGVPHFPKTSGKRGIHIYIPLGARYTFEESGDFAELVATIVHANTRDFTSLERLPKHRQKKVYIDYLQNSREKTQAAPYSLRPVPGALASAPLRWTEVTARLNPGRFNIRTMPARIKKLGDVWSPMRNARADLRAAIPLLNKL